MPGPYITVNCKKNYGLPQKTIKWHKKPIKIGKIIGNSKIAINV